MAGTRHVALLRAINLGRNRRIAMPALRELLTRHGYEDVRTLLASGNVVLTAAESAPEAVAGHLSDVIEAEFGFAVPVIVRSAAEMDDVVRRDPLADVVTDGSRYLVGFCDAAPDPGLLADIDAAAFLPERFALDGRTLYTWHPDGLQASALSAAVGKALKGVTLTTRNWNTVTKLRELAAG